MRCLGISDSVEELRSVITEWKPEMVFNLLEEFDGIVTYDQHVVAFLELLRQPYTGCNPRGLLLSRDKPLCKQLLSYHRISSPQFAVFRRGIKLRLPRKIKYPLFVKSTTEDASLGISQASIVTDKAQLKQRIQFVHDQVQTDALVEEYIEGRELYVGVMGNDRLTRLPVWEMKFGSLPETSAGIATRRVKWDKKYQKKHGIDTHEAKDLPPAVVARLDKLSRRVYRSLGLSGCARIDYRMNADGQIYVIEANPNPNLAADEDFAQSAHGRGRELSGAAGKTAHARRRLSGRVARLLRLRSGCAMKTLNASPAGALAWRSLPALAGCVTQREEEQGRHRRTSSRPPSGRISKRQRRTAVHRAGARAHGDRRGDLRRAPRCQRQRLRPAAQRRGVRGRQEDPAARARRSRRKASGATCARIPSCSPRCCRKTCGPRAPATSSRRKTGTR